MKILGKLCPICGQIARVVYETDFRIVYECSNFHQAETRKKESWRKSNVEKVVYLHPTVRHP